MEWDTFLSHALNDTGSGNVHETPAGQLEDWTNAFLSGDSVLDWIAWDMADTGGFRV